MTDRSHIDRIDMEAANLRCEAARHDLRRAEGALMQSRIAEGPLTKREHFAAMAMQGLRAANYFIVDADGAERQAAQAVIDADALLSALAAPPADGAKT